MDNDCLVNDVLRMIVERTNAPKDLHTLAQCSDELWELVARRAWSHLVGFHPLKELAGQLQCLHAWCAKDGSPLRQEEKKRMRSRIRRYLASIGRLDVIIPCGRGHDAAETWRKLVRFSREVDETGSIGAAMNRLHTLSIQTLVELSSKEFVVISSWLNKPLRKLSLSLNHSTAILVYYAWRGDFAMEKTVEDLEFDGSGAMLMDWGCGHHDRVRLAGFAALKRLSFKRFSAQSDLISSTVTRLTSLEFLHIRTTSTPSTVLELSTLTTLRTLELEVDEGGSKRLGTVLMTAEGLKNLRCLRIIDVSVQFGALRASPCVGGALPEEVSGNRPRSIGFTRLPLAGLEFVGALTDAITLMKRVDNVEALMVHAPTYTPAEQGADALATTIVGCYAGSLRQLDLTMATPDVIAERHPRSFAGFGLGLLLHLRELRSLRLVCAPSAQFGRPLLVTGDDLQAMSRAWPQMENLVCGVVHARADRGLVQRGPEHAPILSLHAVCSALSGWKSLRHLGLDRLLFEGMDGNTWTVPPAAPRQLTSFDLISAHVGPAYLIDTLHWGLLCMMKSKGAPRVRIHHVLGATWEDLPRAGSRVASSVKLLERLEHVAREGGGKEGMFVAPLESTMLQR
ncbi:hypothetical protein CALCODRAFT_505053 [Calocera cornea HHB12733]|uniref:Uncharacterized protein n=1 Tax=Calocera cornea HHB12733 TaxID=1353952 RepID=A0A165C1J6_9BASI|nr:hypothetical protein CALCODRAFT_505053 [Calocera cornea HHB12733]